MLKLLYQPLYSVDRCSATCSPAGNGAMITSRRMTVSYIDRGGVKTASQGASTYADCRQVIRFDNTIDSFIHDCR